MLQEILQFHGRWRNYQQRVLDRCGAYLADHKVHIVAAPGSGKTTLGIELIRRVDRPTLILAPTITIREQWVRRIQTDFLQGTQGEDLISQNLRAPKWITVATYQALHSAMTRYTGTLREEGELAAQEEVDYRDFDLVAQMRNWGLGTLCLDECHHLRSEWWKALEQLKGQFPGLDTISLTATPPYDSTPAMWEKYVSMCGEIDEEITVPELVKEGTLCPHQDYVYFTCPTRGELEKLRAFRDHVDCAIKRFVADDIFLQAVQTHPFLTGAASEEAMLEQPAYLSSMLIYLQARGVPCPRALQDLLGFETLEPLSPKWMEILLQGFLFDDGDSYTVENAYRQELIRAMKTDDLIEKRTVTLTMNPTLERKMIHSVGKCEGIRTIVLHEYEQLQGDLRLLVLADYIRREYESALGDPTRDVDSLGVIPFFEQIRRGAAANGCPVKLGVLCGTVVIIPAQATGALLELAEHPEQISFTQAGALTDYVKVEVSGDRHFMTDLMTQLFVQGQFQVLVGTKSLLGEGWDSPCVNALILASFVGSYMLSNQMRGRAIRVFRQQPDKTSNIWHLVCVTPQEEWSRGDSEDYCNLSRRMEHFLGLHYERDEIVNGIQRLTAIERPFTRSNIRRINQRMLEQSAQRQTLKERWDRSLAICDCIETVRETGVKKPLLTTVLFFDALRSMVVRGLVVAATAAITLYLVASGRVDVLTEQGIYTIYTMVLAVAELPCIKRLLTLGTPLGRLRAFGEGLRAALEQTGQLDTSESRVETEADAPFYLVCLQGGTGRDKTLFSQCVQEFFAPVDNQRYLLYRSNRSGKNDGYFAVPDCFAKRKEDALLFAKCMERFIGRYEAVYTRNAAGRRILLQARKCALANRQDRCISRQKVKGALE